MKKTKVAVNDMFKNKPPRVVHGYWFIALPVLLALGINGRANAETVLIQDDFNNGVINTNKWITGGSDVTEHDGILDIQQNVTDAGGWAKTFKFTSTKKLRLEVEHTMHPGGDYYFPNFGFEATDKAGNFGVSWQRSDNGPDYCDNPNWYNKVMVGFGSCSDNFASTLASSDYYDRPIKSIITYDSSTGKVELDVDGDGTIDFSATAPAGKRFPIKQVSIGGYGWWTGHYHQIDSFMLVSLDNPIVKGTVAWTKPPYSVQCKNNTTVKSVSIPQNKKAQYDCEKAGLVVNSGDDVSVTIRGKKD